jgi:RNA polymerase sigma-70 factor (ECF subfamily)
MPLSDEELLRRLKRGDSTAFAVLVDQYKGLVLNLVSRMSGNVDSTEDLAQEVFLRVWKGVPTFRGESKLSTWIYRIALNLCIAEGKTARGRAQFMPLDDPGLASQPQLQVEEESSYAAEVVLKQRMRDLIPKMPEKYRIAITLYYLKDLSYLEIGEIMDVPMGTVKSYLFRGKAWLREQLMGHEKLEGLR